MSLLFSQSPSFAVSLFFHCFVSYPPVVEGERQTSTKLPGFIVEAWLFLNRCELVCHGYCLCLDGRVVRRVQYESHLCPAWPSAVGMQ